ncbi:MAG: hypothetical protein ACRC2T_17165 [Thermoguttaceae bacterium]
MIGKLSLALITSPVALTSGRRQDRFLFQPTFWGRSDDAPGTRFRRKTAS